MVAILAVLAGEARASDFFGPRQAGQFQPEVDVYFPLGQRSRLQLQVQPTFIPADSYSDITLAAFVSWHLSPFVQVLLSPDIGKGHALEVRLGIQYNPVLEPGTIGSSQTVVLLAGLTPRLYLPWSILVTDRNRFEARWIDAAGTTRSFRYRNLVQLEREFEIHPASLTAFADVEFIWDSAKGMWSQFRPQAGLQYAAHWFAEGQIIELNYMAITYLQPSRSYAPVLGLVFYTYF